MLAKEYDWVAVNQIGAVKSSLDYIWESLNVLIIYWQKPDCCRMMMDDFRKLILVNEVKLIPQDVSVLFNWNL